MKLNWWILVLLSSVHTSKESFLHKFSLTTFICSRVQQRIDSFSLPRSLVSKLVMPGFGQGRFVRVYGRQGKLDKCTRNSSMVLANERRPWREINVLNKRRNSSVTTQILMQYFMINYLYCKLRHSLLSQSLDMFLSDSIDFSCLIAKSVGRYNAQKGHIFS
jgi:hypothetical protein